MDAVRALAAGGDAAVLSVVSAAAGAAVALLTHALTRHGAVRERRGEQARADARAAQDALAALRTAYARAYGDAVPDWELDGAEHGLMFAAHRTLSDEVIAAADAYVAAARAMAALEDDPARQAESVAFQTLADALRAHLAAHR